MADTDYSIPVAKRFADGAAIIAAAQPDADVCSEHDQLWFGTARGLSAETLAALDVLGWFETKEGMSFFT